MECIDVKGNPLGLPPIGVKSQLRKDTLSSKSIKA